MLAAGSEDSEEVIDVSTVPFADKRVGLKNCFSTLESSFMKLLHTSLDCAGLGSGAGLLFKIRDLRTEAPADLLGVVALGVLEVVSLLAFVPLFGVLMESVVLVVRRT